MGIKTIPPIFKGGAKVEETCEKTRGRGSFFMGFVQHPLFPHFGHCNPRFFHVLSPDLTFEL
jgi:hypothetical protein